MQILIGCAKDMADNGATEVVPGEEPMFKEQALHNAMQMAGYGEEELMEMLGCNAGIARQNRMRYLHFTDEEAGRQAVLAYTGIVFKHLRPGDFSPEEMTYAQQHLWITSFLYGLLRPTDRIKPYRLEGNVVLPQNGVSMFDYWKPLLTDRFIALIKADGGVLTDLASNEMRRLFDWKKVEREVRVIHPDFQVYKGGRLKTVTVYSKMCRGEMARYILTGRITNPDDLKAFSFEGFTYSPEESKENNPVFVLG